MSLGVGKGVCITSAEVNEPDITVDACQQDVVRLQVKVEHLVAVQVAYDVEQLPHKLVGIAYRKEVVRMRA